MSEKLNIDEVIMSVPVCGWIAIGVLALCAVVAVCTMKFMERKKQEHKDLQEINESMQLLGDAIYDCFTQIASALKEIQNRRN